MPPIIANFMAKVTTNTLKPVENLVTRNAHVLYEISTIYYFVMNTVFFLNMSNIIYIFSTTEDHITINSHVKKENDGTH